MFPVLNPPYTVHFCAMLFSCVEQRFGGLIAQLVSDLQGFGRFQSRPTAQIVV